MPNIVYFTHDAIEYLKHTRNSHWKRIHDHASNGKLKRFVYANLGQIDNQVPIKSPNCVDRETVIDYPTNFNAYERERYTSSFKPG